MKKKTCEEGYQRFEFGRFPCNVKKATGEKR